MYSCDSSCSESALRQKIARMLISWSSIIRPMSHKQQVVSKVSLVIFLHRIKLIKILVISLSVSRSMSFVRKQEITIVFKHSWSKISCKFCWFSDNREKHLQLSYWKILSFCCMKNSSFPRPPCLINSRYISIPLKSMDVSAIIIIF
jgi:hypothetical protein